MVEALGISLSEYIFYLANFIILVVGLAKFLYKPFMNTLDARKQKIADDLDSAEAVKRKAEEKLAEYERQMEGHEAEGREIVRQAKIKADKQAEIIIDEAGRKADLMIAQAEQEIERERKKAIADTKDQIGALALMAAEKIMEKDIQINGQDQLIDKVLEEASASKWQS